MPGPVAYLNNANVCLDYVVGAESAEEFDDAKCVVKQICSNWKTAKDADISVEIIGGGITNRLYRLIWDNKSVLVRVYGDNTEMFIDRNIENSAFLDLFKFWYRSNDFCVAEVFALLSERKFAPIYYGCFTNGRIEGWLDARPLKPEDMGQTEPINYLRMIARELGTMHIMEIPGDRAPVLWTKMNCFEKLAIQSDLKDKFQNKALEKIDLARLHQKMQWLMSVLPSALNCNGRDLIYNLNTDETTKQALAFASDVVFSHNDLLSGNILHNKEWNRVQIIDYEYGGYNFRGFDLANHFCENCGFELDLALYPSVEKQMAFFKGYMSTAAPELLAQLEANNELNAFLRALNGVVSRYALASHLLWGYWALVQTVHSKIDFDFLQYAAKRFDAFDKQRELFCESTI